MAHGVVHFEIACADSAKGQAFYKKLFDWSIEVMGDTGYGLVPSAGEGSIGGGVGPTPKGMKPHVSVYVHVDDLQEYLDKAEQLGGKTIQPPTPIPPHGSVAMFTDPEGNPIGLWKPEQNQ